MTGESAVPVRRIVRIINERGLHARAAALFVKLAATFEAEIQVAHGDHVVPGRSIMGLMLLAAAPGTQIVISAEGPAAVAAVDALADLVDAGFGET